MTKVKTSLAFQRLLSASRKRSTRLARTPWRTQTKRVSIKLTPIQKAARKAQQLEAKCLYQDALHAAQDTIKKLAEDLRVRFKKHSYQYYLQELMQISRLQKKARRTGLWNAFVSMEVKRINDELPEGEAKKKVNEVISTIAEKWQGMSVEERTVHTAATLESLQNVREMRQLASHNVPIAAFHDVRVMLENVNEEIMRLHERTGIEALLVAVRSSKDQYYRPYITTTSNRVADFFKLTMNTTAVDMAIRMEAYMLSGVQAVVRNYVQEMIENRSQIAQLIALKLKEAARSEVAKMFYNNFDTKVTAKYGVTVKGWPLQKFCSPSQVQTRTELELLRNAWTSGAARFHKMSRDEWTEWLVAKGSARSVSSGNSAINSRTFAQISDPPPQISTITPPTVPSMDAVTPAAGVALDLSQAGGGQPLTYDFVNNVVTGTGNEGIGIAKKARKVWKDKGKPRKKHTVSENDGSV